MAAGNTDFELYIDGAQVTSDAQWDATWEERTDGVGSASVTVQDRNNDPTLLYGWTSRQRMTMKTSASAPLPDWVLWDGETIDPDLDLPVGMPWRRWRISGTDWNTIPDLRAVGVPTGDVWLSTDGGATFQPVDPSAVVADNDQDTVRDWFDAYARRPDGSAFGTDTYVNRYINTLWTGAGDPLLEPLHTTLRGALSSMAGLAGFPIFCWIDPDGEVHWQAFPSTLLTPGPGLAMGFPEGTSIPSAPATITDYLPNGVTSVGGRGLRFKLDFGYAPQETYVNGTTDFIYNGGVVIYQGTGWGHNSHFTNLRQIVVDAQSVNQAQRDAVADAYAAYSVRPRVRGQITIGGRTSEASDGSFTPTPDGWRAGQLVTIIDSRLPDVLNGKAWPIQRVAGSLRPSVNARQYTIEFGDAPLGQFSQKYRTSSSTTKLTARQPAVVFAIYWPSAVIAPSTTYTVVAQALDRANNPIRQSALPVEWALTVTDTAGVPQLVGSITPITTSTDSNGQATASVTTDAGTGLFYDVSAQTNPM
jgi:hypothetical protein